MSTMSTNAIKKILSLIIVPSLLFSCTSCSLLKMPKSHAKEINKILDSADFSRHEEIKEFMEADYYKETVNKYYKEVFGQKNPQSAFSKIHAIYDFYLFCDNPEDFLRDFSKYGEKTSIYISDYLYWLWTYYAEFATFDKEQFNIYTEKILSEFGYEADVFKYFAYQLLDKEIPQELSDYVLNLENYVNIRLQYCLITVLGSQNKVSMFEKLILENYINEPFTGVDITYVIVNFDYTDEQLDAINDAFEKLKYEYEIQKPNVAPLKIGIIEGIQKDIEKKKNGTLFDMNEKPSYDSEDSNIETTTQSETSTTDVESTTQVVDSTTEIDSTTQANSSSATEVA